MSVTYVFHLFTAPTVFAGHTAGIRHVFFLRNDTQLVSCADDRTLRVWDRNSAQVINSEKLL